MKDIDNKDIIPYFTISSIPITWFEEFKVYCQEYTNDNYAQAIKNLLEDRKKLELLLNKMSD